jgi:hypothetical protein
MPRKLIRGKVTLSSIWMNEFITGEEPKSGSVGISDMMFITIFFQPLLYLKVTSSYQSSSRCLSAAYPLARKTFATSRGQ